MTCGSLELRRDSLFEVSFLYRDPNEIPINLSGLVDEAEFTIRSGDIALWTGTIAGGHITPFYSQGRFDVLIPESVIDLLTFQKARYRFRISWIIKGWETLADEIVTFDD